MKKLVRVSPNGDTRLIYCAYLITELLGLSVLDVSVLRKDPPPQAVGWG